MGDSPIRNGLSDLNSMFRSVRPGGGFVGAQAASVVLAAVSARLPSAAPPSFNTSRLLISFFTMVLLN
jgi:hypothetical protein